MVPAGDYWASVLYEDTSRSRTCDMLADQDGGVDVGIETFGTRSDVKD